MRGRLRHIDPLSPSSLIARVIGILRAALGRLGDDLVDVVRETMQTGTRLILAAPRPNHHGDA